jgi:hypothetical protein
LLLTRRLQKRIGRTHLPLLVVVCRFLPLVLFGVVEA